MRVPFALLNMYIDERTFYDESTDAERPRSKQSLGGSEAECSHSLHHLRWSSRTILEAFISGECGMGALRVIRTQCLYE